MIYLINLAAHQECATGTTNTHSPDATEVGNVTVNISGKQEDIYLHHGLYNAWSPDQVILDILPIDLT